MSPSAEELIKKYRVNNQFGKLLGMEFKILSPGHVEYFLEVKEEFLATPHSAHGGLISAFMDGLLGVCGLSAVAEEGKVVSTIEFKINFFNPVFVKDQLRGEAKIEHKGSRILILGGIITVQNRENILVSKAMGTFNSYPASKAGY